MATILTTGSATATALNFVVPNGVSSRGSSNVQTPAQNVATTPSASDAPPSAQPKAVARELEQVQQAIKKLKESIRPELANTLDFQVDDSTGRTIVKVMDTETNTVVRQIPSEEMMAVARAIDRMQGRSGLVERQA